MLLSQSLGPMPKLQPPVATTVGIQGFRPPADSLYPLNIHTDPLFLFLSVSERRRWGREKCSKCIQPFHSSFHLVPDSNS